MKPGEASRTAQGVAAQRLMFERVAADFGDPDADERLARDVVGAVDADAGPMSRYLAARTAFFDRVVVNALVGGVRQVVVAAAGYDGRALRYAKAGVRWFEVDHPDTQSDKRSRLERLAIETDHIAFVPADFEVDNVATALSDAGHDPSVASLMLVEGVAVYLDRAVLESLLAELRAVAAVRTRLAISLSVATVGVEETAARAAFRASVAAVGEPARTILTVDDAAALFSSAGWRPSEAASDKARRAGFVVVEPDA